MGKQVAENIRRTQVEDRNSIVNVSEMASPQKSNKSHQVSQKPSRYRFYSLFLFCLIGIMECISWICFSSLFEMLEDVYGVSLVTINYMSFSYMLFFLIMSFPSTYVLDKYGLRAGLLIGVGFTVLGCWLRCLVNKSFYWVVIGQTINAIAQPFMYNAPIKVTENWFPENERPLATMTGSNSFTFGILVGFAMPKIFVRPAYVSGGIILTEEVKEQYRSDLFDMLFAIASFSTALFLLAIFTLKEKPTVKFSYVQHNEQESVSQPEIDDRNQQNLKDSTKDLILKKPMQPLEQEPKKELSVIQQFRLLKGYSDFWKASISTGFAISLSYAFTTVIGPITVPYKANIDVELLGILFNVGGVIGNILTSIYATYDPSKLLRIQKQINTAILISLALFWPATALTPAETLWPVYFDCFIVGFFIYPLFFVAYEVAVAQTSSKPGIGDTFACGIVNLLGNFFGVIQVAILTAILIPETQKVVIFANAQMIAEQILALLLILLTRTFM